MFQFAICDETMDSSPQVIAWWLVKVGAVMTIPSSLRSHARGDILCKEVALSVNIWNAQVNW
jgi:hypothetical protein